MALRMEALESRRLLAADLFQGQQTFSTGITSPGFVNGNATADLNGDGKADLVVTQAYGLRSIFILLGKGDGTFQAPTILDVGQDGGTVSVALGDVDGDGIVDIAATTFNSISQVGSIAVFIGHGDGTFAPLRSVPADLEAGSLRIADLNGDGRADFITESGNVAVILQKSDGTFQPPAHYDGGNAGDTNSVAVGDLNGDGRPDIVATNHMFYYGGDGIGVLLNNGDGTFAAPTIYGADANEPAYVVLVDVNGDGKLDIIDLNAGHSTANGLNGDVDVLINNGTGTSFAETGYGTAPDTLAVTDLNGDGHPDMITSFGGTTSVALGRADGTFSTTPLTFATGPVANAVTGLVTADFNGDGLTDALFISRDTTSLTEHFNTGNRQVEPTASSVALDTSATAFAVGTTLTYTATVTVGAGLVVPTGTITFIANVNHTGDVNIGTANLVPNSDGSATAVLTAPSTLPAGTSEFFATYAGDSYYIASHSNFIDVNVTPGKGGGGGTTGGAPVIATSLGKVSLPTTPVVAGQEFKASAAVVVKNTGGSENGSFHVAVYLSPTNTLQDGAILLGGSTKKLTLKTNAPKTFAISVKSLPAAVSAGTYFLIASVLDPMSVATTAVAGQMLTVAAPVVSVEPTVAPGKAQTIKAGKTGSVTLLLSNSGNTEADGPLAISLFSSIDGQNPDAGGPLATATAILKLKPGKPAKYVIRFKYGSGLMKGAYFPYLMTTFGGVSKTVVGSTAFTLS